MLLHHLIICSDSFYSFADEGLLQALFLIGFFYALNCIATMMLLLRRTPVRL
jgi:hypothetical protein